MKLRKLCNHPDLVTSDYHIIKGAELDDEDLDNGTASDKLIDTSRIRQRRRQEGVQRGEEEVYGHYSRSGKMIVVQTLLKIWLKQNHKVLLFTQSKLVLYVCTRISN